MPAPCSNWRKFSALISLPTKPLAEYRRALSLDPGANDRRERLAEFLMELDRKPEALAELAGMTEGASFRRKLSAASQDAAAIW